VNYLTEAEAAKAFEEVGMVYFLAVSEILFAKGHKEFNFLKSTIHTPNGGTYLLQIQHVDGPKIDLTGADSPPPPETL